MLSRGFLNSSARNSRMGLTGGIIAISLVVAVGAAIALGGRGTAVAAPLAGAQTLAIDADPSGNTATALGPIDGCRGNLTVGDTFDVDVVVDAIPAMSNPGEPTTGQGLAGFEYDFTFDPSVVQVTGASATFLLSASGGVPTNFGESPPQTDGDYHPGWADISTNYDAGAGALERITLLAVGNGLSALSVGTDPNAIGNPVIADSASTAYGIAHVLDATIRVGSDCGAPTPSPTPSPIPTPTPTGSVHVWGNTDCGPAMSLGDAVGIGRHLVSLPVVQQPGCPAVGSEVTLGPVTLAWGDWNCNGGVSLADAIAVERALVELPVSQQAGCPAMGQEVTLAGIQTPVPMPTPSPIGSVSQLAVGSAAILRQSDVAIPLTIQGSDIAAVQVLVQFDPSLISPTSCFPNATCNMNFSPGTVAIAAGPNFNGLNGEFASITFHSGDTPGTSPLSLTIVEAADTLGTAVPLAISPTDGSITVTDEPTPTPTPTPGPGAFVSELAIGSATVGIGSSVAVPLTVAGNEIARVIVHIQYDPALLTPTACTPAATCDINIGPDTAAIAAGPNLSGLNGQIGTITFTAANIPGVSPLTFTSIEIDDTLGDPIPLTITPTNGSITITESPTPTPTGVPTTTTTPTPGATSTPSPGGELDVTLTINPTGSATPSTGEAIVSGSFTCSEPASVNLFGELTQRSGRSIFHGFFDAFFLCEGTSFWSAKVTPQDGLFTAGKAVVNVDGFAYSGFDYADVNASSAVRLKGSGPSKQIRCPNAGNDGFELGVVDTNEIPCWTVVDQEGGFGSWCNQAGTAPPQGDCLGNFVGFVVAPPPEGNQAAMANQSGPGSHLLYRCGILNSAVISFQLLLYSGDFRFPNPPTLELGPFVNEQFRVDILSSAAMSSDPFTVGASDVLMNIYQTQPGDLPISAYDVVSADASAHLGEEVCLRFAAVDNYYPYLNVGIDDVSIEMRAQKH